MPKGGASSLTPVYAGLSDDLSWFLKAFLKLNTYRFSDYKRLFQELDIIQIFNGRSHSAEIIEFNENLLVHCLPFMERQVCPGSPRRLNERLFGLYSLYTFFYLQADNHVVKVRVDPDAARNFQNLTAFLLQEQIYDAYMCCLKLQEDKAFKIVAYIPIYDPTFFKRFDTDNKAAGMSVQTNLNDPLSNVKTLVESVDFARIGIAHKLYSEKRNIEGVSNKILNPAEEFGKIIEKVEEAEEITVGVDLRYFSDYSSEELCSRGMQRSEIKDRAYGSELKLSRARRHMTTDDLDMETETFEYEDYDEPLVEAKVELKPKIAEKKKKERKLTAKPKKVPTPKVVKKVVKVFVKRPGRPKKGEIRVAKKRAQKRTIPKEVPVVPPPPVKKGRQTNRLQNSWAVECFSVPKVEEPEVADEMKEQKPEPPVLKSILKKEVKKEPVRHVSFQIENVKGEPTEHIEPEPIPEEPVVFDFRALSPDLEIAEEVVPEDAEQSEEEPMYDPMDFFAPLENAPMEVKVESDEEFEIVL